MNTWYILMVEDDVDGQEVVGRILLHHHIRYDIARNGDEALEQLLHQAQIKTPYTGVIIDLHLPGTLDGWHLLKSIRSQDTIAEVTCVAVTAYHAAELAVKAIETGFNAYFPKPLEATNFVRELERVFND